MQTGEEYGAQMLEHVSLTVRNIPTIARFLCRALPDFRIRGSGTIRHDGWTQAWSHVGNNEQYIALYQARRDATSRPAAHSFAPSANHVGFMVDDVETVRARLLSAGYREGHKAEPHKHRRRVYFVDPEGFEWEFVQYLSGDDREKNQY